MQDLSRVSEENVLYKDVVIVGNGPAGIFLSFLLNGNWPYYNGQPHPGDEMLTARLQFVMKEMNNFDEECDRIDEKKNINTTSKQNVSEVQRTVTKNSLLEISEHDLKILASGIEGRGTCRPLALLLDQLQHPCVDAGLNLPGLLLWRSAENHSKHKIFDHVSLGKGPPGGAWQFMDPNVLTISLDRWMSLPGLELQEWETLIEIEKLRKRKSVILRDRIGNNHTLLSETKINTPNPMRRIPVGIVAAYYKDYVIKQGLAKYFKSGRTVTSVRPMTESQDQDKEYAWIVQGYENQSRRRFYYKSKNVVLATGTTNSFNRLGITGEETKSCWVTHQLNDFETRLDRLAGKCKKCAAKRGDRDLNKIDPVLVIGAGLSAADAIIAACNRGIPVIHAFRESVEINDDNLNGVKLSASIYDRLQSLPVSIYPEYHEIYEMMTDGKKHRLYKALPGYRIIDLGIKSDDTNKKKERIVSLQSLNGQICRFRVSIVAILIGAKPDLSYLGEYAEKFGRIIDKPIDGRSNPIEINDFTYEVVRSPRKGLYAIGPLVGDNFVRFILGGAFGVAAHLIRSLDTE